jgi:hypothetical protein
MRAEAKSLWFPPRESVADSTAGWPSLSPSMVFRIAGIALRQQDDAARMVSAPGPGVNRR